MSDLLIKSDQIFSDDALLSPDIFLLFDFLFVLISSAIFESSDDFLYLFPNFLEEVSLISFSGDSKVICDKI